MPENAYPKEVTMHFRSLPHFMTEDSVYAELKLPNIKKLSRIMKEKLKTDDGGFVFTEEAYSMLLVENKDERADLSKRAAEHCTTRFNLDEMEFYCNNPTLLSCEYCLKRNRNYEGHHKTYYNEKEQTDYYQRR